MSSDWPTGTASVFAGQDVWFVDILSSGEEITAAVHAGAERRDRLLFDELPATKAITSAAVYTALHVFADAADWRGGGTRGLRLGA